MRITRKGQVTIPKEIRNQLGLWPHTDVEIVIEDGCAVVRRRRAGLTIGRIVVDRLKQGPRMIMSSKELLALLRDEPDEILPH